MESSVIRVMFVCLGNICRSPLAHGIFQDMVDREGMTGSFDVASSGTDSWHMGQRPDRRMRDEAHQHGVDLDGLRAQRFRAADLATYDHILVMDKANLRDVLALDPDGHYAHKVRLFRTYDPEPDNYEVPDPYYEGGFDTVFNIVDRSSRAFFQHLIDACELRGAG